MRATKNGVLIVVVLAILGIGCKKNKSSTPTTPSSPALTHTKEMAGSYHWTGSISISQWDSLPPYSKDSNVSYDFDVVYFNDSTIYVLFNGAPTKLLYTHSLIDSALRFENIRYPGNDTSTIYITLYYDYQRKRMDFSYDFETTDGRVRHEFTIALHAYTPLVPQVRYTKEIAGAYHWTGTTHLQRNAGSVDSTWPSSYDFSITYIDDYTVQLGIDTMELSYDHSNESEIAFSGQDGAYDAHGYPASVVISWDLVYNYKNHTLNFRKYYDDGPGWDSLITLNASK